jgi:hypothetical protein
MTEVIADTVEVDMKIDGEKWLLSEVKVELSRNRTPNYVDINKMAPDIEAGASYKNPNDLIGKDFSLNVDNDLISERDTDASEKTLLFKGKLANISAIGTNVYEGIAYDPSQQALNSQEKGNILNQEVEIQNPLIDYGNLISTGGAYLTEGGSTEYTTDTIVIKASKALEQVLGPSPIEEKDIQLSDSGKEIVGPRGSFTGAEDVFVRFDDSNPRVGEALQKIAEETKSFWWFDREGVFHFGVPEPTIHAPQLITDTSAGLTTPPYQSVKVIGSDVASSTGYSNSTQNPAEPIVKGANLTLNSNGEPEAKIKDIKFGEEDDLTEPTFVYENQEIIIEAQANNVVEKIAEDLGEQYVSGKLTVVGFPEVEIFDVVIMPHAEESKQDVGNYSPRQPMGGGVFGVYKVVHKLNPGDGFITDIHTAGMTGPASVLVEQDSFVKGSGGSSDDSGGGSSGSTDSDSDGVPDSIDTRQGYGL